MNLKRKLLIILISFIIIPINTLAYSKYLIPGGENIGISIKADGVYIVGFYKVNNKYIAKQAGLKLGDRIISINGKNVSSVNELMNQIKDNKSDISVNIEFIRNNVKMTKSLKLSLDNDGTYKTGLYVKDSIVGIGTLTYIDPSDNSYGALGHEILESNSMQKFIIKNGNILESNVTSIKKSTIGNTGEKNAKIDFSNVLGDIKKNKETGIYGNLKEKLSDSESVEVADIDEVQIGKAEIITVLNNNEKKYYDIKILSIDKNSATKNFLIEIVDKELLEKTDGIIKGMSGSPIIQNGKIIGAVTHAIVDKPNKGYGISIIKMLEKGE